MEKRASTNTIAILLILALVFAGIGVGIAINNYTSIEGQYTEVPTNIISEDRSGGEVVIEILPPEEGEEGG